MRTAATVVLSAAFFASLPGCGGTLGGPNEDDVRDPTTLILNVSYSTVLGAMDEVRDALGDRPTPESARAAKAFVNENMEHFENLAADERLEQAIYGPALEIWKQIESEAQTPRDINNLLVKLERHMKSFPPPPPVEIIQRQAQ